MKDFIDLDRYDPERMLAEIRSLKATVSLALNEQRVDVVAAVLADMVAGYLAAVPPGVRSTVQAAFFDAVRQMIPAREREIESSFKRSPISDKRH